MIEALIGALVGGLISGFATWWHAGHVQNNRNRAVSSAIGAEISSLVSIGRANRYADILRHAAAVIEDNGRSFAHPPVIIPAQANYFAVFDANAGDLGHLPEGTAVRTIAFYHVTRSWIESLSPATEAAQIAMELESRVLLYRDLAGRLDRLCEFGDSLMAELATPTVARELSKVQMQITGGR